MGDLAVDTAVQRSSESADGTVHYRARLSRDWEIWGPNGGYLAAVVMRAAGATSRFGRIASLSCHFHGVATFDEVELAVEVVRAGRDAESLRVAMTQGGRSIADAMLWSVADDLAGLEHDDAPLPDVADPDQLEDAPAVYPFWRNFDRRPLRLATPEAWLERQPSRPVSAGWYRYRPAARFDEPWTDACRPAILLDTMPWPAAAHAHREDDLHYFAPSLDVSMQFHRMPQGAEWLFVEATSPVATQGLVGGMSRVWAQDGRLLATARQQMLCRPLVRD